MDKLCNVAKFMRGAVKNIAKTAIKILRIKGKEQVDNIESVKVENNDICKQSSTVPIVIDNKDSKVENNGICKQASTVPIVIDNKDSKVENNDTCKQASTVPIIINKKDSKVENNDTCKQASTVPIVIDNKDSKVENNGICKQSSTVPIVIDNKDSKVENNNICKQSSTVPIIINNKYSKVENNGICKQASTVPIVINNKDRKSIVSHLSMSSVCRTSSGGNINENESEKGSNDISSKQLNNKPSSKSEDDKLSSTNSIDEVFITLADESGKGNVVDIVSNGGWSCKVYKVYSKHLIAGNIKDMKKHNESGSDLNKLKRPSDDCMETNKDEPKEKVINIENEQKKENERKRKNEEEEPISKKIFKFFTSSLGKRKLREESVESIEYKKRKIESTKHDSVYATEKIDKFNRIGNNINDYLFYRYLEDCEDSINDKITNNDYSCNEDHVSYTDEELQNMYDDIDAYVPR